MPAPHNAFTYTDEETGAEATSMALLPNPQLTASAIMGGTVPERTAVAQTLGTQIATRILEKAPGERRELVLGVGLQREKLDGDEFRALVELVLGVL
jgi:proteasome assembly chaperone 3